MTTTATTPGVAHGAFRHELLLHDGVPELVELMVPFVREGAAAGEHVVVLGEPDFVRTLMSAVPDSPRVRSLAEPASVRYPGRDLHRARQVLAGLDATGAGVRVVNQMPRMTPERWREWRRYEAAVNVVLAPFSACGTCAHDRTTLPPEVLAELLALHPHVRTGAGSDGNPRFDGGGLPRDSFVGAPPHAVENTEPTVSLLEPTPAAARRVVRELAAGLHLSATALECAMLATGETVTNARVHGYPPVRLRVWAREPGRLTVAVTDSGPGPDPLVGLVPERPESLSGRGMWLVHLLLDDVHHRRDAAGYTVTFSVDGDAPHLPRVAWPVAG